MDLVRYILRRLFLAIFVLLGVVTITFLLSQSLGNPIYAWLGKTASSQPLLVAAYVAKYHLNDPILTQYYYYIVGLLHGNLGYSPSEGFEPVTQVIAQTFPNTLQIAFFAAIFTLSLGILLGVLSAFFYKKPVDVGIRSFYLAGASSPSFVVALDLLLLFVYVFHLLPSSGSVNVLITQPKTITHIPMLDSILQGNWAYFWSALQHVVLPSLALALTTFGIVTRVLRSSMLDVMRSNYIRTARAKGVDETGVFFRHGLRNALIPTITISSFVIKWLISGSILVESVFAYPGIGQYLVSAVMQQDYPGVIGVTLIFAVIIVIVNLVADILYVVVDPQIRLT